LLAKPTQLNINLSSDRFAMFNKERDISGDVVGSPMKCAIVAHLPDEHFVIRVDGRVKSRHRRFVDALREGLQLRDQFPQHDVKVQSMKADGHQRTALH
jgi:hypothetical protein